MPGRSRRESLRGRPQDEAPAGAKLHRRGASERRRVSRSEIHVWIATLDQIELASESRLLVAEHKRLGWVFNPDMRRERVLRRVFLRHVLGGYLGCEPSVIRIESAPCVGCGEPHGKPSVPGVPLRFSVTSRRFLAAVAVSRKSVAIDVEFEPTVERSLFMKDLLGATEDSSAALLGRWVRAEAYGKLHGVGLLYRCADLRCSGPEATDGWTGLHGPGGRAVAFEWSDGEAHFALVAHDPAAVHRLNWPFGPRP